MTAVVVPTGVVTKVVSASSWNSFCDIYEDSGISWRVCYDGGDQTTLSIATPGSEVGAPLNSGGYLFLRDKAILGSDVYVIHNAGSDKRLQIQKA